MRVVNVPTFHGALAAFSSRLVAPILDQLPEDEHWSSNISLLSSFMSSLPVRQLEPLRKARDWWMENGLTVRNEYELWQNWLDTTDLSEPAPGTAHHLAPEVRHLFSDLLYGFGLGSATLWATVNSEITSRSDLCRLFREDMKHSVCPYCDLDSVRGAYSLEHFVPRSFSYYLCVAPNNLYVACDACNSPQKGKGATFRQPLHVPLSGELGESLEFNFTASAIELVSPATAPRANFVSLLKLKARYTDPTLHGEVLSKASRVAETAARLGRNDTPHERETYHRELYWLDPLFYASRAFLRRIP